MKAIPRFIRDKFSTQFSTWVQKMYLRNLKKLEDGVPLPERNPSLFNRLRKMSVIPPEAKLNEILQQIVILDDQELKDIQNNIVPLSGASNKDDFRNYAKNPEYLAVLLNNIIASKIDKASSNIKPNNSGEHELYIDFSEILIHVLSTLITDKEAMNEIISIHAQSNISNQNINSKLYKHFQHNAQAAELNAEGLQANRLPKPRDLDKRRTIRLIEQNLTLFIKNIVFYEIQGNYPSLEISGLNNSIKPLKLENSKHFENNQNYILKLLSQLITYLSQQKFSDISEQAA